MDVRTNKIRFLADSKISLVSVLFLVGIFLKQFYTLPSGMPQIGDLFMLASSILLIFKRRFRIERIDYSISILLIGVFIVNTIYFFIYTNEDFLRSSFYWFYCYIILISFRQMMRERNFAEALLYVFKTSIVMQILLCVTGIGRTDWRYLGTFENPNQLAFFVLFITYFIHLLTYYLHKTERYLWVWYLLSFYLIFRSSSTAYTVAYLVSIFIFLLFYLVQGKNKALKKAIVFLILILIFSGIISFLAVDNEQVQNAIVGTLGKYSDVFSEKVLTKFQYIKMQGGIIKGFLYDRASERLIVIPKYYIYGSGEGYFYRFHDIGEAGEIHCTMLAVCYYYGLIPYTFFIIWLVKNLYKVPTKIAGIFIGVILVSFAAPNQRQPLFWMIFVLGGIISTTMSDDKMNSVNPLKINIEKYESTI